MKKNRTPRAGLAGGRRRPAGPGAGGRAAGRRLLAARRQCWRCAGRVRAAARGRGPGLRRRRRTGPYARVRLCLRAAVGRVWLRHACAPACPCPVCSWLRVCASCAWVCMSRARAVRVRAGTTCATGCEQAHDAGSQDAARTLAVVFLRSCPRPRCTRAACFRENQVSLLRLSSPSSRSPFTLCDLTGSAC